jgi:hypothetical protein
MDLLFLRVCVIHAFLVFSLEPLLLRCLVLPLFLCLLLAFRSRHFLGELIFFGFLTLQLGSELGKLLLLRHPAIV